MITAPTPAAVGTALYRFEGELTDIAPIGLTHAGARFDSTFEAALVDGTLGEGRVRGVDYFLLRPDGVGVIDTRFTIEAREGHVHCHARGYVVPPPGMPAPPLDAVMAPGFRWPDIDLPITEAAFCETGAPALAHLNHTVAEGWGTVNMATRRLVIQTRALS